MSLMDDLRGIADLADQGDETARAFMEWFSAERGVAESTGTYPSLSEEQSHLHTVMANTVVLFLVARAASFIVEHDGALPEIYNIRVSVDFESL